jgi:alpha-amylase
VRGALDQLDGDKDLFRLAAILQFTSTGLPMIYYGEEVARRGGDWPENRSDMPWGDRPINPGAGKPRDEAMRSDYKKLIALRKAHPALSHGVHDTISTDGDLLVFSQRDDTTGDQVIVAVNRGSAEAPLTVAVPWQVTTVTDSWINEHLPVEAGVVRTVVGPRRARIITEK